MSNFLPSLESFAKGTFATFAGLSTLSAGLLWYGQNYLIYPSAFPEGSRTYVATPAEYGIPYENLDLLTADKVTLRCYLLPQRWNLDETHAEATEVPGNTYTTDDEFITSRPTVIMFHGNGGNAGHRIPLARVIYMKMRCNVLMLEYRGYGLSEGSPSEKGIRLDAQAGLDYLTKDPRFSQTPIVLYGQSIGGAVSIDLASRNPSSVSALILENTFTSLPELIPTALPALSRVTFLCHQKWDSASKIGLIPATTPILMLSGMRDELVPKEHMRRLWEIVTRRGEKGKNGNGGLDESKQYGPERAKYVEFEFGDHNDTCIQPNYWHAVAEFVASVSVNRGSSPASTPLGSRTNSQSSNGSPARAAPQHARF